MPPKGGRLGLVLFVATLVLTAAIVAAGYLYNLVN